MTVQNLDMPVNLLSRIRAHMPSMSRSDVKIARKLLESPYEFAVASVRSIAADIGVSEPTVVRFCRGVGCDGFKDLKFRLTQELAFEQARSDAAAPGIARDRTASPAAATPLRASALPGQPARQSGAGDAAHDAALHIRTQAHEALDAVASAISAPGMVEAATIIAGARKVCIYGIGGSSAIMAEEVHNRLFRLGIASVCYTDSYAQRMSAAALSDGDVALFVTSTGRPRSLQESLELAKYYGARTVAITDCETPIGRDVDICIHVCLSQSGVHEFQPNPMRFAQLLVIDVLAFHVADAIGAPAKRILRQTRASIASLHGIAPQQPIGD